MAYKLVTYNAGFGDRAGIVVDEKIIDIAEATKNPDYRSTLAIFADWSKASTILEQLSRSSAESIPFNESLLRAPVRPAAIYCAGANYGDHVAEMAAKENREVDPDPHSVGLKPWHFIKSTHAVVGPHAVVRIPPASKKMDWEIELAAVIGKTAKDVSERDALTYVAGYTLANDLSARDLSWRPPVAKTSPFYADWVGQKNFDGACPLGPWIVPASEIPDPQNLAIRLSVNGVVKQDSNTSKMIFTLAEQIEQLSLRITLHPGDVILTGTPAGVGVGRDEFLNPGDRLELWCEGVGTLVHSMSS